MALPADAEGVALDAHQRYEVAALEIDDIREETGEVRAQHEALMDALRAQIEATDVRIAEIKKDAYEFKRDIVIGAESSRTGKTVAEKAVRYMDDKIRAKGAVTEKLRLKNSQIKAQAQKLEAQLQQKEDAGGSLRAVDFDQLKIENQQQLEKIEERNSELLRLKLTTGNTIHVLNSLKQRLAALNEESEWLRGEAAGRHAAIAKLADEAKRVDAEHFGGRAADAEIRCVELHTCGVLGRVEYSAASNLGARYRRFRPRGGSQRRRGHGSAMPRRSAHRRVHSLPRRRARTSATRGTLTRARSSRWTSA